MGAYCAYFNAVSANVVRPNSELREEAIGYQDRGAALFGELIKPDIPKASWQSMQRFWWNGWSFSAISRKRHWNVDTEHWS